MSKAVKQDVCFQLNYSSQTFLLLITDGFVVYATVFNHRTNPHHREKLHWFDMSGNVIAIHSFIGGGLHRFLPVLLKHSDAEDESKARDTQEGELYLYFADGLGALYCIRLTTH